MSSSSAVPSTTRGARATACNRRPRNAVVELADESPGILHIRHLHPAGADALDSQPEHLAADCNQNAEQLVVDAVGDVRAVDHHLLRPANVGRKPRRRRLSYGCGTLRLNRLVG